MPTPGRTPPPRTVTVGGPGDENVLRNARLAVTDEALVEFFRKRTPPAPPREKLAEILKRLGAADLSERDAAQAHLTAVGQAAVPLLRTAANNADAADISTRARQTLQNIEGAAGSNLVTHVARFLATRRPAGAAEVLIGYLPYAEDDHTFQEIEVALVAVALRDGKPDLALIQALRDKNPLRRGTAAQVLCQAGGASAHAAVRPLLRDPRPSVRLRAALGLVGAYDADAIPVLIDLLGELPPSLRQQAEDYLIQLAGEWAVTGPRGNDLMSRRLRREVWAAWWRNTDGARLLEEFRSRTTSDEELLRLNAAIDKLGDSSAGVRDSAINELLTAGKAAASLLRRVVNDGDPKVAPLAAQALESLERDAPSPLPAAAPRLLGLRRPEGTVETLLQYLPFAESADLSEQLLEILGTVAVVNGRPDEALVKALADRIPLRRATAALALCRGKALGQVSAVRRLLADPDPTVRLRAAQGLAQLGEREAIPALIALLRDLPLELSYDVEDYLGAVAGDRAPTEVITADPASRGRAVEAWTRWWNDNRATVDLARMDLARRDAGVYLIVENWNPTLGRGRVLEVDPAGKVRWEITGLQWPNDAQVLRGGNVLIVEQQNRVSERDRTGKVVGMNRNFPGVFHVDRLRDGSTFVACRNQLLILDARGNQVFHHPYTMNSILAARRFRDGSIAYVSYNGHYVRLDRDGKVVKSMNLNFWNFSPNGAEILPGDRVIVGESRSHKVVEFAADGKRLWECAIPFPLVPQVTPTGNVVVAANNNQVIYEIDRRGKVVKEWKGLSFRPYRVFRR